MQDLRCCLAEPDRWRCDSRGILTNQKAVIIGPTKLVGKKVKGTDLRGTASLVLAGLIAEGETIIDNADYVLRGYEGIIEKLTSVGADISLEEVK